MSIDDLNELLGTELPDGDWDTVGGFIHGLLGHVATEGESVDFDGFQLTAERVQGRRIGRVKVTMPESAEPVPELATEPETEHDSARS
jgi:putative hemolysin